MGKFKQLMSGELDAKRHAEKIGVQWPPKHWYQIKAGGIRTLFIYITDDDRIRVGQRDLRLAGAEAMVDTSGNLAWVQGWVFKSQKDTRQMFFAIRAGDGEFTYPLPPNNEAAARRVAAAINTLSNLDSRDELITR